MTHADINIAVRGKGEMQRLPQKPLALGFIPISSLSLHANGLEELPLGT